MTDYDDPENYEGEEMRAAGSDDVQKISLHLANKWISELSNANIIPSESAGEQLYCWLVDLLQTKPEVSLYQYLNARERKKLDLD